MGDDARTRNALNFNHVAFSGMARLLYQCGFILLLFYIYIYIVFLYLNAYS